MSGIDLNGKISYSFFLCNLSFFVTLIVFFIHRPEFADTDTESEEDELEEAISRRNQESKVPMVISSTRIKEEEEDPIPEEAIKSDRRLQRLMNRVNVDSDDDSDRRRRRDVREPEIIAVGEGDRRRHRRESSGEEEVEDESIERRHALIREMNPGSEGEEEEGSRVDEESDEESEYEEYTDSEEETVPRLKPIFVRKEGRVTAKEREIEEKKEKEREEMAMKEAKERREQALKMIQEDKKREEKEKEEKEEDEAMREAISAVMTDDEDEETSYEMWKVRELKRMKREKEEREGHMKELEEIEKLRNMTEEERQGELEKNPKIITNQYEKSKYKFLQKYYHRGAFYLDEENEVFKRDIGQPTLEDHHDKEILPKVMQVKNFGRSGRTKYTHLVDQDTTARDSPWIEQTPQTTKFFSTQAAGMKPIFDRPSKRRKQD